MRIQWDIAVVGGGASGLAAACIAARCGCRTVILERGQRVGRKLLATGNGKCNLSNVKATSPEGAYFSETPEQIAPVLSHCTPEQTLHFFRSLGLLTRTDNEGRIYPYSEQASAVLDVLRAAAQTHGAQELCEFEVSRIRPVEGGYLLQRADGTTLSARAVIVACGGPAAPANGGTDAGIGLLRSLGHASVPLRPSLTPLKTEERLTRPLKGLRVKCDVSLLQGEQIQARETGELQFGDGQLSGICIFQLSRKAGELLHKKQPVSISVDLMPALAPGDFETILATRAPLPDALPAEAFFTGLFAKKIGYELMRPLVPELSHRTIGSLTDAERIALAKRCRDWRFPVTGTGNFAAAQVTAGGIRLDEFDPATMASRRAKGVFACGEVLDVDGLCGGFNLQWAWSSGLLAGLGAAARCGKEQSLWAIL